MPAGWSEAEAVSTVAIAIFAIWGPRISAYLVRPKLRLKLRSNRGEHTQQAHLDKDGNVIALLPARYYHVEVANRRLFPPAHEVEVWLTCVETPGPNGQPQIAYQNDLPLNWMHGSLYAQRPRTIAHWTSAYADLFVVTGGLLAIIPVLVPTNFSNIFLPNAHFWVTLVARGVDCQSNYLRLKVDWDGQWHLDDAAMALHLTVDEVPRLIDNDS